MARLISLLSVGLAAGIAVGVFLVLRAWSGSAQLYTELMQLLAHVLTVPAPVLGVFGLVAMAVDGALLFKRDVGVALWLLFGALLLSVAALAITKLGNFPLNAQMAAWTPTAAPAEWTAVRARWASLHAARTACAVLSFALLVLSNLLRR
jgi:uncharacterized membrane protein